ncbi:ATP-binding protein [Winogradskyella sp. 3972H.M.0a.05]|uniref:ATP-binding protein n=1 Tax=Winogradskyella sp. 3972H.M.0a.05 TaxID=2950277 RepID=UPI003398AA28
MRVLFFIVVFCAVNTYAQVDTTSIQQTLKHAEEIFNGDVNKALELYLQVRAESESLDYTKGIIDANSKIAFAYIARVNKIDLGDSIASTALNLATKINYQKGIAENNFNLGILHSFKSNHESASKHYLIALDLYEKLKDTSKIIKINRNMGFIHTELKELEESKKYLKKAVGLAQKTNDDIAYTMASTGLVQIHLDTNNLNECFELLNELEIKAKKLDKNFTSKYHINYWLNYYYTQYYYKVNKTNKALDHAIKAKSEIKNDNDYEVAAIHTLIGDIYRKMHDYKNAEKSYRNAKKRAKESKLLQSELLVSEKLFQLLKESNNNDKEKIILAERCLLLKDSLYNENILKKIAEGTEKYELEKKDKEIAQYQATIKEQENSILRQKVSNTNTIAIICVSSLLLISFIQYQRNKSKTKYSAQLKQSNEELYQAKIGAEKAYKDKSLFLNSITHELKTPLNAIIGISQLLSETRKVKASERESLLETLSFSGKYLLGLVNNVLTINLFSEKKDISIAESPFNIEMLLNNVIELTNSNNNNKINYTIGKRVPKEVIGDEIKLVQILFNLISNANKFTENGNINITILLVEQINNTIELNFSVKDTGIGISQSNQQKIFDTFFRVHSELNSKYEGSGLGLSIIQKLLKLYNRELYLISAEGKGSTFSFSLPFKKIKDNKKELPTSEMTYPKHINILAADDNLINQMLLKKTLDHENISFKIASNGKEVLDLLEKNDNFDLILIDMMMPVMDGFEASEKIREFNEQIPIVAFTSIEKESNLKNFEKVGIKTILNKPIDKKLLHETIFNEIFLKAS